MKLNKWLYGAAAFAMLTACSDRDVAPDSPTGEGSGYVGVRIQMPTIPSTRANDAFDDGAPSEYKLNDAVLVLFQGADEASAKCVGAFELKKSQLNADVDKDHQQITTQVTRVASVTGVDLNDNIKLYALVIANGVDHGLYYRDQSLDFNTLETDKDGGAQKNLIGLTVKDFQETVMNNDLYTQDTHGVKYASSIVMTNSPLTTVQGGKSNPGTISGPLPVLVELNNKVWPSEAEALANPAGIIHVERAVGKITCSKFNKETSVKVTLGDTEYTLVADQISWDMAQDMSNTYLVRNTNRKPVADPSGANLWMWNYASEYADATAFGGDAGVYRMLGHAPIINTYYRPYFCQVPGYGVKKNDNYEDKTFTKSVMLADDAVAWSDESAFYPRENTFPVDFMKYANTTRIGFWVTFKLQSGDKTLDLGGKNFYTKGLNKSVIYLDDEHGRNPMEVAVITTLSEDENVKAAVEAAMKQDAGKEYKDLFLGDLLDIDTEIKADGEINVKSVAFKPINDPVYSTTYEDLFKAAPSYTFDLQRINNLDQVYQYTGGKVFYEVRIKHFGDDLTPWDSDTHPEASTIEQSYGSTDTRSKNYLGRYGIVRNNWYDLNVEIITKLGEPTDPARWDNSWPGKPDDNKDEYIAVILRVLSWAKRTQGVIF
ncbi:MAG: Mfa1 fimbrilin C-terminal domain-containing protein [Muribaculaceae bacterium]|nr:Mfa1 fimbrilin C-terminal domain-containing protein [Muribaculaceae bacterium]